jgi:hypothetical protein
MQYCLLIQLKYFIKTWTGTRPEEMRKNIEFVLFLSHRMQYVCTCKWGDWIYLWFSHRVPRLTFPCRVRLFDVIMDKQLFRKIMFKNLRLNLRSTCLYRLLTHANEVDKHFKTGVIIGTKTLKKSDQIQARFPFCHRQRNSFTSLKKFGLSILYWT